MRHTPTFLPTGGAAGAAAATAMREAPRGQITSSRATQPSAERYSAATGLRPQRGDARGARRAGSPTVPPGSPVAVPTEGRAPPAPAAAAAAAVSASGGGRQQQAQRRHADADAPADAACR
ncbi:translation initiation factor IF-2-like [Schistocerca piceifrons]|uniref:translation initiation factor IF-2-like n=1 Tax=Schistocerca piceifrons TaxID=274613 RepID=UPI001F5FCE45|nr:translation initiation factor IF-2-like [Schistocerca piceifrons]